MTRYLRLLLLPFTCLYGLVVVLRNWCYNRGLFKSQGFDLTVICVGNLDVGGAGKSPMTEYLVRLLKGQHKLAVLSRGYGRATKGFIIASAADGADQVGDEPAQFKQKFADVTIAVCEKRVIGIENLQPDHDLIILDDAYQHRAVKPGLSILLFDYNRIDSWRLVLPAGNLREPFSGRQRADVLIVSKCPLDINEARMRQIGLKIKPFSHQRLFFTGISYTALHTLNGINAGVDIGPQAVVFLLTGIANPYPLVKHLQQLSKQVIHHKYPDHHQFTLRNIAKLALEFDNFAAPAKLIITTEKDAQRLRQPVLQPLLTRLSILVLPVEVLFLGGGKAQFDQLVIDNVRKHTTHNQLH